MLRGLTLDLPNPTINRRRLLAIEQGDVLALETTGAYGMVMASNYNARPRAAEVMVDRSDYHVIRKRETVEDLLRGESTLP